MVKKLRSTSGESIAETLVAVLIAALALLMLAGTVNSSSRIITNSKTNMERYYQVYNTLADNTSGLPSEAGYSKKPDPTCVIQVSGPNGSNVSETFSDIPYCEVSGGVIGSKKLVSFG